METFEMRYFLGVARSENIHTASLELHVSPGSLSKAVGRLEKELLLHSFVSPSHPLLGRVGAKQSLDGWRDDHFPRKVEFLTSSLKLLEELVVRGKAIAYLPEYFAEKLELEEVRVLGCPYYCTQKIRLVAKKPKESGWLNQVF